MARHVSSVPRARATRGLVLAGVVMLSLGACATPETAASPSPSPSVSPSVSPSASHSPEPTPSASATTAPVSYSIPATCEGLYTPEIYSYQMGLNSTLGKDILNFPNNTMRGTNNVDTLAVIDAHDHLTCTWTVGGEAGSGNDAALLSAADGELAAKRDAADGFRCAEERGGTLCVKSEDLSEDGYAFFKEQKSFYREGVWLGLVEHNFTEKDIMADMITAVFEK